ncbi:hypothetical protein KPH14_011303 [Odynerus spinipes]|uniref:Uncharacterized protein n=1 Tax=Odynerus spinipes TaxID=1348599 RepID=A0AAD9R9G2_9HYME|nr:hypothetical protein KPH14_011303 [Odynerus spinipes]
MLLCRLCGTNLQNGRLKHIFEDSTDLKQKIIDTLPINISPLDGGSKFVCISCHDKVILYHKFIQEVLKHEKELDSEGSGNCFYEFTQNEKEQVDIFAKICNDTIYSCPNCNVDLMILLVSNSQSCDYSFQISLALVGHTDKTYSIKQQNIQSSEKLMALNMKWDNVDAKNNIRLKTNINGENIETRNINTKHTLTYDALGKENSMSKTQKDAKRKLKRNMIFQESSNPGKIPKLEVIYELNPELINYYKDKDKSVKLEFSNDNIVWFNYEDDYNFMLDEEIINKKDEIKTEENDNIRCCPRIICDLCGTRYISQLKYEFHMERHKLDCMDRYICPVCKKEASNENLLWDHYFHMHKSSQRFVCLECGKLFSKYTRVKGHQKKHKHSGIKEIHLDTDNNDLDIDDNAQNEIATKLHGKTSANCNLCGKLILDLDPDAINDLVTCSSCDDSTLSLVVDGNEAKVISPRQYHCSKCPKHFVRKERLEFHEMRHNENMNEFICSTCGKEFSAENSLYEHYLFVHKGARPHICELCGKSFQLKARLREHHRTHTGERPFQCDVCGQRCTTKNALRLHRKIHFSQNRYTCNICNKSFSKKQNMNEHLEKHWKHDKNILLPQLFTCPMCTEDFPTYRMLKYHMIETHKVSNQDPILIEQKPWYECGECHEKFKHQMSLKAHKERIHEGKVDPVYQCDTCNVSYRVKQLLINHIRSKHNGEKRYKCAQCEKGFNDTKSLYNHVLLHTGKKPFVCEYCNMKFRRKDSRDHHRRKHTGELPYQCQDCGEHFATYNYRSKHRKQHHGKGDIECPECGEKCNDQQEIRIHLNNHLGEKLKLLQNV